MDLLSGRNVRLLMAPLDEGIGFVSQEKLKQTVLGVSERENSL